jgi:hypothetical protein
MGGVDVRFSPKIMQESSVKKTEKYGEKCVEKYGENVRVN